MTRFLLNVGAFGVGFGGFGMVFDHFLHMHRTYNFPSFLIGLVFLILGLAYAVDEIKAKTPSK